MELRQDSKPLETLTLQETAERLRALGMHITPTTVRDGLKDRRFPFGDYIPKETACVCYVYPRLLEKWIAERAAGLETGKDTKAMIDQGIW